jgi:hypothetical protein
MTVFPNPRASANPARSTRPHPADLEIGDTADLEVGGTVPYRRLPNLLYRGFPNPLASANPARPIRPRPADLEIGDTADLEVLSLPTSF